LWTCGSVRFGERSGKAKKKLRANCHGFDQRKIKNRRIDGEGKTYRRRKLVFICEEIDQSLVCDVTFLCSVY
jgi:hypothetical protein